MHSEMNYRASVIRGAYIGRSPDQGAGPAEYLGSRSARYKLYNIISLFAFTAVTARPILGIDFPPNWITLQYVAGNFMIHLFLNVITGKGAFATVNKRKCS